jgi:hypothetical protein
VQKFMQQSMIWKKIKKPFQVGLFIAASFFLSFFALHFSEGMLRAVMEEIMGAFIAVIAFTSTLSVLLFNYVDGISKDVAGIEGVKEKIQLAISRLDALKREIIETAVLLIVLLVIELAFKGISSTFIGKINDSTHLIEWAILSVRFTCFTLAILAVWEQVKGLLVAIEFRSLLFKGKKL